MQATAEHLLLADDLPVTHVRGALDLALDVGRVERAAAVVRRDDAIDGEHAGLAVDRDLGDGSLIRVRRGRPDAGALERASDALRRLVPTRGR